MIRQKVKNFNLGSLKKTRVTASSCLILIMSIAREIGLIAELEKRFSHLKKRKRGYSVSEKILSFIEMLIKGERRLNDIDILSSDPGLLDILRMYRFPRANTIGVLTRGFSRRDINNLANIVMKLSSNIICQKGLREIVIDIDSSLIDSEVEIAEKSYEGFRGFNPLMGIIKGKGEKLRDSAIEKEVAESVHFVGSERGGDVYRFVVVRRKSQQMALFPEFQYTYRVYFTNTDWDKHRVVHFYRQRGDAENIIKEEKEGFAVDNILAEDFLANAAIFQLQLLAYNLVQYFKYSNLEKSWWNLRIKQLRFRLINIA